MTPKRDGITLITASPWRNSHTAQPASIAAPQKKSPSNRRDKGLPAIVRVATGVAQKIAEATKSNESQSEVDFEQLMNAPCYIYFEEHH